MKIFRLYFILVTAQFLCTLLLLIILLIGITLLTTVIVFVYCSSIIASIGAINFKLATVYNKSSNQSFALLALKCTINTLALLFIFNINILIAISIFNKLIPGSFT